MWVELDHDQPGERNERMREVDPNVALRELREAIEAWHGLSDMDNAPCEAETDAALKVINAAEDIDAWLTSGGFMPTEWGERAVRESIREDLDIDTGEYLPMDEAELPNGVAGVSGDSSL